MLRAAGAAGDRFHCYHHQRCWMSEKLLYVGQSVLDGQVPAVHGARQDCIGSLDHLIHHAGAPGLHQRCDGARVHQWPEARQRQLTRETSWTGSGRVGRRCLAIRLHLLRGGAGLRGDCSEGEAADDAPHSPDPERGVWKTVLLGCPRVCFVQRQR